jgi:pyrimidine-nucleoside phosphorylase
MYDIIRKKRDGEALTSEEIDFFCRGYVAGEIPDYQAAALCMAIYFRGMSFEETLALTLAIRDSGERLCLDNIDGLRVDKHSTGGVGDKTSLVITPIVATLGVKVAKMSGRGLGHTGGTVDKLEAIPGFKTELSRAEFERIVNEVGIAIVGQNATLAPLDKLLYALRDVTATVDSMPLIVSSIMGKKLCADDDCILLDVKTGSGSFMKTLEDSKRLSEQLVRIGKSAGKRMRALITDMDRPLGYNIGNSLEVIEAIETLRGKGPEDLTELCIALSAHMLNLADRGTLAECEEMVKDAIDSGAALNTFAKMVKAQGGREDWILDPSLFPSAKHSYEVKAQVSGYVSSVNTEEYGRASLILGAGRSRIEDKIDPAAGIRLIKKTGGAVCAGDTLAVLYTEREDSIAAAEQIILAATRITPDAPPPCDLILGIVE